MHARSSPITSPPNPTLHSARATLTAPQDRPAIASSAAQPFDAGIMEAEFDTAPPGDWRPPSRDELRTALSSADRLFARHLASSPDAQDWLDRLAEHLAGKKMAPNHAGVEFYIRFKAAYSDIHHLGYGTMWRDHGPESTLKVAFMHQESIPPTAETGTVTGKFLNTFDTADLLGAKAPVDQSMDLVGMPDMNVYSVPEPKQLQGITAFLDHPDAIHPYGLFQGYGPRLKDDPDVQHINCFAATEMASITVHGGAFAFPHEDPVPHCIDRLGRLTCTDVRKHFDEISVKGTPRKLDDIAKFDPNEKIGLAMAAHVGRYWGEDNKWDVPGRMTLKNGKATLKPGEPLDLPRQAFAIKLMSRSPGLTLGGKPLARQPYKADDVARMTYEGSAPLDIHFLYAIPAPKL